MWCFPKKSSAAFVCAMEDILKVYTSPTPEGAMVVCMDETSKQLTREILPSLAPSPGRSLRYDAHYERNGVASLFMFFAPLEGWRRVSVSERRTTIDWAHQVRELLEVDYPEVEKIILVMDNLNTHNPAALYKAFPPETARHLLDRLEFHFTPVHGSWLNVAEIELRVLCGQCLNQRIPDMDTLKHEVSSWQSERNNKAAKVDWRFASEDARIKLKRFYPIILN
jgi:hypothetical protein